MIGSPSDVLILDNKTMYKWNCEFYYTKQPADLLIARIYFHELEMFQYFSVS